jgi:hypothetical protein
MSLLPTRCSFAFLDENRLDDGSKAFGQIIELADVIGVEGLVASAAMPSSNLRGVGLRLRWTRDLVELPNLLGQ